MIDDRTGPPVLFGWWGVTLAWLAWGAINVLRYGVMPEISWADAVRYGFPDALLWAALTPLIVAVSRRFEVRGERRWRNLGVLAMAAIIIVVGQIAIDAGLASLAAWFGDKSVSWRLVFFKVLRYELHTRLLIFTLATGLVHYQIYARRLVEERAAASRLAAQLTEARLTNLQRQLRPHFLFNALQAVSESMEHSPERGRRVVRRLGELLRASLRADDAHWIPLEAELDLVRAYLEIESVRFEDRLRVHIDAAPEALACWVPSLLLQPIVENAVNHGVAPSVAGGTVVVRASLDDAYPSGPVLLLDVEDDGVGWQDDDSNPRPDRPSTGSGIGLANTRDRLDTLYGNGASLDVTSVEGGGVRVSIRLPVTEQLAP